MMVMAVVEYKQLSHDGQDVGNGDVMTMSVG